MTYTVPNTGIPSPILLAILATFAVWFGLTVWYARRRNR